jgi:hypothetical protein
MTAETVSIGPVTIAILQRGWVFVGRLLRAGEECSLHDGYNIRIWGTDRGLGQIALEGPTPRTILDPCPTVRFHVLTAVALMDCKEERWSAQFPR